MKVRFLLLFSLHFVTSSRDFYVGMFKKEDLLVATDTLYKDRTPFSVTKGMYGRLFKCDITYFRVVDRLGAGRIPRVEITRGGLRKKYIVLRITSGYNLPLSVNIYVGCENKYNFKRPIHIIRPTKSPVTSMKGSMNEDTGTSTTAAPKIEETENKNEGDTALTPKANGGGADEKDAEMKPGATADAAKPDDGAADGKAIPAEGGDKAADGQAATTVGGGAGGGEEAGGEATTPAAAEGGGDQR